MSLNGTLYDNKLKTETNYKHMKKILSIIAIIIAVILLSLIILPFAFKGKILEVAKKEVNKTMNAQIDFESLGLNFFKSFPNATVTLSNFYVAGIDEFEGDTLLFAKNLSATDRKSVV